MRKPDLDKGEKLVREIAADRGRYWRDHGVMAVAGMAGVGGVLWLIGNPHVAIGALGAVGAVAVRAAYLASEALSNRWWLTDRRLILPDGKGAVMLLEVVTVRRLMGDVQLITKAGDKHLLRHVADPEGVVAAISDARDRRARRVGQGGGGQG